VCMWACVCGCVYMRLCVRMCVCGRVHARMCVCVCVCECVCVCLRVRVCVSSMVLCTYYKLLNIRYMQTQLCQHM